MIKQDKRAKGQWKIKQIDQNGLKIIKLKIRFT